MAENDQLSEKELQKQRNDANNTKNVRNAADVAIASGHPVAAAAGGAVKAADEVTGGKASEVLGKGLTVANKVTPGGNRFQRASNQLSESGLSDVADKAASIKNAADKKTISQREAEIRKRNVEAKNAEIKRKGEQQGSPSSSEKAKKSDNAPSSSSNLSSSDKKNGTDEKKTDSVLDKDNKVEEGEEEKKSSFIGFLLKGGLIVAFFPFVVAVISVLLLTLSIVGGITGLIGEFDDAFGISNTVGEDIGGLDYRADEEHQVFFDRVNNVRIEYQEKGLIVDPLKVVSVFHILMNHKVNITYKNITIDEIKFVANALFDKDGISNDEAFRNNLIQTVIPRYLPKISLAERETLADEVFQYIDDYYALIGKDNSNALCSTGIGVCSYELKGYYVKGKGNIFKNENLSNLYVRIMQCNSATNALDGEELIPFEKYILGTIYASTSESISAESIKAQAIAERNYLLGQHVVSNNNLKKEGSKSIIQVSSCHKNLVYCDPDRGCSSSSDGIVHSGLNNNGSFSKNILSESSFLRRSVRQVEGELLENAEGYIIYIDYSASHKSSFISLANKGYNYKQILMQYYNQGNHNYGASDISRNSCSDIKTSQCVSTGEFSKWKQTDPLWSNISVGNSGKTLGQIGCLVTSVAMQIAKSGVKTTISNFNPGTFTQFLNRNGGFTAGGNFVWNAATKVAPDFRYQGMISVAGMTKEQKLAKIRELSSAKGVYVVAEVMGNTGQHWVAIDSVMGNTINIMDSGSKSNDTNMWSRYNWINTSALAYYRVS